MPNDPRPRRSLRLSGYDYSHAGAYFITACTQNRVMLFGEIIDDNVRLNEMGTIVQQIANNPARWADTQRTSRERCLPKQGGFETRPYKSPDLCAVSRKKDPMDRSRRPGDTTLFTGWLPDRPGS